jgi:hypothetical protein
MFLSCVWKRKVWWVPYSNFWDGVFEILLRLNIQADVEEAVF